MNEKNPEGPSVVMDLRLTHQYAQVLIIPVYIFSNNITEDLKDILKKIRYENFFIH